jgi:hypothetical protein
MLKIYNPGPEICDDLQGCYYKNFLAFDIEYDKFIHTKNIHDADVIAIHGHNLFGQGQIYKKVEEIKQLKLRAEQKLLLMHIFHLDHTFPDKRNFLFVRKIFEQELENQFAFVHTNFALEDEIQYDFLFNRQKIYFTNYNLIDLQERLYVNGCDIKNFELASLNKAPEIIGLGKRFLCPNRIYSEFDHPRFKYRRLLQDYIRKHSDKGFFSDFENNQLLELEHNSLERSKTQSAAFLKSGGWYPVANYYYQHSFFSIYCETVSGADNSDFPYKSITEKTWNPLIKGHFILPFGYQGLIDHIRSYGFKLPDFIDYSYDYIEDDQTRFDAFVESAEKLMSMSIYDLQKLHEDHKDILLHNRRLFWHRPYDSLYDKVVDFFEIGK